MLHLGENTVDGVPVTVVRHRAKRILIRIRSDGSVRVTLPQYCGTLKEATDFFNRSRNWIDKTRCRILSRPPAQMASPLDLLSLEALIQSLMEKWTLLLDEQNVTWKFRSMKTRWGVCNYIRRKITFATNLAMKPTDQVEYVVVHELTHLKAHGHGADFQALMDARLPGWRSLRRALNR